MPICNHLTLSFAFVVYEEEILLAQRMESGAFWFLETVYGRQADHIMYILVGCVFLSLVLIVITTVGYGLMVHWHI